MGTKIIKIRIYTDSELSPQSQISLGAKASHHLCKVLRLQTDDTLTLFNGDGFDYDAVVIQAGKNALLACGHRVVNNSESPLSTHLLQGVSRSDKMDTTIQKSVELGVNEITPVLTYRSMVKFSPERLEKKLQHWRNIGQSACEQSGRSRLPIINEPVSLTKLLAAERSDKGICLVMSPLADTSLNNAELFDPGITTHRCSLLIGPESGLTEEEIKLCCQSGFTPISMGPRILRTETAGPAALAILQLLLGDLGS